MRVQFKVEGGLAYFPGLSKPHVLDSDDLPAAQADRLRQLVDAADFFQQPAAARTLPKGAADYQQYTITVEDGRRRRTIRLTDPIRDADLAALVEYLRKHTAPSGQPQSSDDAGATR